MNQINTSIQKALTATMKYLQLKDRSVFEVRTFLEKKEFLPHQIDDAIAYMQEKGYLNDLRYAGYYISEAFEKGKSKGKIEMELLRKGIPECDIRLAMDSCLEFDQDEEKALQAAQQILMKEGPSVKTLRKIGSRLGYLGFEAELIYNIIEKISEENDISDKV